MVNSERIGLIDSYVLYGAESTFGTGVATTNIMGGLIQKVNFNSDRTIKQHAGMAGTGTSDGRVTVKYTPGTFSLSSSIEFLAQEFDWLEYLMCGTKTGAGTVASPYVYSIGKSIKPLTVTENINNVTDDSERTFTGIILNSATIKAGIDTPVSCSVNLIGGRVAVDTSISTAVAQSSGDLYNFAGGTIEMPNATLIGNVIDSVEISYDNQAALLYGLSEEAVNARLGKLVIGIKFTLKYLDDDQMTRLLGSTTAISSQTPVTLGIKFVKGTNLYVDFVFTNVVISKISDNHSLNEWVVEDVDNLAQSLVVTEAQS